MIYVFSCCKTDRTGEKMVVAFEQFPQWQDIQIASDADAGSLNFFAMKPELANVKRGIDLGINKVYAWEYMGFTCQIFAIEVVKNGR